MVTKARANSPLIRVIPSITVRLARPSVHTSLTASINFARVVLKWFTHKIYE